MCVLEGSHVVGAVAAHEDGEPLVPQTSHHTLLLLGSEPGEHFDVGQDLAVKIWKVVPAGMVIITIQIKSLNLGKNCCVNEGR